MRLFLDANVLFSAARDDNGRAAALIAVAGKHRHELLTSPHAVEEARRNLEIKNPDRLERLQAVLDKVGICPECLDENATWAREQSLPDKDAPILGAAAQARANLLVTGDRTHFGHLYGKVLRGVVVVTPADALAALLKP